MIKVKSKLLAKLTQDKNIVKRFYLGEKVHKMSTLKVATTLRPR
jgi:hypothetical protein